jgi:hypothetical protein
MTVYLVDIAIRTHTCPGDGDPHPYDIGRQVVHVIPGGPCQTPLTISDGDTTTQIPCASRQPADRQCHACRTVITERTITVHHDGAHTVSATPAPQGDATEPCTGCGQRLAAVLAAGGRHILCQPRTVDPSAA